jgi:hypothetical protein
MTAERRGAPPDPAVGGSWRRLLDRVGHPGACWRLDSDDRVEPDAAGPGPSLVELREVFVRADPAQQRTLDLLCVVLVERATVDDQAGAHELVVFGPEALRTQSPPTAAGVTVADLRVGPAGPDLRSISVLLVRAERRPRVRDMVSSIEDLGRVIDYRHDTAGSAAVARAVVDRLEVLAATPGVEVSIAGVAGWQGVRPGQPATHQILVGEDAAASLEGHLEVREGRVMTVGPAGSPAPWLAADFVLLRAGSAPARRGRARSLYQLRRELALVEAGLGPGTTSVEESYSARATRARQSSRAERIMRLVEAGDVATAQGAYREALAQPGADGPLADSLADRVGALGDWWPLDAMLEGAAGAGLPEALRVPADAVRQRLGRRLDQLLGMLPDALGPLDESLFLPTPIVFEVSDALVPFVDSRQDGGRFLYELIPAMRDGIQATMGVTVPGVRARGNPSLGPGRFEIQVDEIPAHAGMAFLDDRYVFVAAGQAGADADAEPTNVHPLTGAPGLWQVRAHAAETDPGQRLTIAEYLAHSIGLVIRAHLTRYLGPQEVELLVDRWAQQDEGLVASTLPDKDARLRLTWVLQSLVDDGVPIVDWQAILEAVRAAGGIDAPLRELRRGARARLRDQLPPPRVGDRVIRVPEPLEAALLADTDRSGVAGPGKPRLDFQLWLRETVERAGPVIALVTGDQDARELVAPLARSEHPFITTLSDERPPP